ncbi:peptide chain release factor N(5)-glutamine methyltransferase [Pleurocapsales cyanobacterium LEGE 06147]|nr:peptide chain release factor N(5)-glutamine methyltransferase [Pleurocapsales cyanobacterium LEGE 06147]
MVSGRELYLWREQAKQAAIAAQVSPAEVDWLLRELAGLDSLALRLELFSTQEQVPLTQSFSQLKDLWQQRIEQRLPVQYLAGTTPWRHFRLKVSPAVLIPRPETELIIDIARQAVGEELQAGHWVDLGTGSGAIALGLAENFPQGTVHGVDVSAVALAVARENAVNLGLRAKIHFYQGNWWSPLAHLKGKVSGMVANPPYIPTADIQQLQPEVVRHEPHLALDGGTDGLKHIRHLIEVSTEYLRPGGIWLIEMMAGQGAIITQMLQNQGNYHKIQLLPDLAGIERFTLAYRR